MRIEITFDEKGRAVITDLNTGRAETVSGPTIAASRKIVMTRPAEPMPLFGWDARTA
jgi:hypothetical protein